MVRGGETINTPRAIGGDMRKKEETGKRDRLERHYEST